MFQNGRNVETSVNRGINQQTELNSVGRRFWSQIKS